MSKWTHAHDAEGFATTGCGPGPPGCFLCLLPFGNNADSTIRSASCTERLSARAILAISSANVFISLYLPDPKHSGVLYLSGDDPQSAAQTFDFLDSMRTQYIGVNMQDATKSSNLNSLTQDRSSLN